MKVSSKREIINALLQEGFSKDVAQVHFNVQAFATDCWYNCKLVLTVDTWISLFQVSETYDYKIKPDNSILAAQFF